MLDELEPEKILREVPQLEEQGLAVSRGIHDWILEGGESRRDAVDVLHGTWLGHPLHPVLTDLTIGAWTLGFVFDLFSLASRSKGTERAADNLLTLGNITAAGTALSGIADYSAIPRKAVATGTTHGLLNTLVFVINLLSARQRKKGRRGAGLLLSSISSSMLMVSGWLGGELAFKYRVGVNQTSKAPEPTRWYPALNDQDLPEMKAKRVEIEGSPVLLYRYQGQVYAIGAVCGHEGGPLDEGSFDGYCVTCPWHQSVYDIRDGSVVHGPTTYAEPSYEARVEQGRIEVRLRERPARLASGLRLSRSN